VFVELMPLLKDRTLNRRNRRHRLRLRTVSELFPEVIQGDILEDALPSCSAVEALERQEPFVNSTLANHALALLARLFRYGTTSYHGAFVSLSSLSSVQALRVDPKYWQRLRTKARRSGIQKYDAAGSAEAPARTEHS
jgi:sulfur-carrier protein adenylyltransferase/sulfurtransferase